MPRLLLLLLILLSPAARADDPASDPLAAVKKAFTEGKPIPELAPEQVKEEPQLQEVVKRVKDAAQGCAPPCGSDGEIARYKKALGLVCKVLRLTDVAAVQAVYCPGEPAACRLRKGVAARVVKAPAPKGKAAAGLSDEDQARLARKGQAMAEALALDKRDDLAGGPAGMEPAQAPSQPAKVPAVSAPPPKTARADSPVVPSAEAAAATGPAGFFDRILAKLIPDKPRQFVLDRAKSTDTVAQAAAALLAKLPGARAKQLTVWFAKAMALSDPAARAEALRPLIAEADRVFETLLARKVGEALAAARRESCKATKVQALKNCLAEKPKDAELEAAREKVFTDRPDLGLYFIGRSEHQLFMKGKLAEGALSAGMRLEPWELGEPVPEGTTIVVAADKDEPVDGGDGGSPFLGLTFAQPDGSTVFRGQRPAKEGAELLVVVTGKGGERTRATAVVKPGREDAPLKARTEYFAPGGRLVREETMSGAGAHVELKDFNLNGKEKELRRYEIRDSKGGKTRVEVRDPDHLTNTISDYDGSVTIAARVPQGLPVDPKDPKGARWVGKSGRLVNGQFQLSELQLEDKTVLKGSSASGRFLVTDIEQPDGKKLHGFSDAKGQFHPTSVIEKDGSGQRQAGRVLIALGPGGKALRYSLPLTKEKASRANAAAIAAEFVGASGQDKARAGALGEWLYDQMRHVTYGDGSVYQDKATKKKLDGDGDAVRGTLLVTEHPAKEVVLVSIVRVQEVVMDDGAPVGTDKSWDEPGAQTVARWEPGTKFRGESPATVLQASDEQGVPQREYVDAGVMRQWFKGYSNDGDAGLFTSAKEFEHAILVQFHRDPDRESKWISACAEEDRSTVSDAKAECPDKEQIGKPHVIHTTGSGLSDLAGELGDIPGLKQAGNYATKGYYTAVGYIQQDIGFDNSSNEDKRLAVIANKFRGTASKEDTLFDLKSDKELLRDVDEKVVDKRKETHHDECVRLGDRCDEHMRSLNCASAQSKRPCASDEERLGIVEYAYSPSHAIDYAAQGGSKFLYVLGGLGQAGEMAAASLPVMGLTEGLGALGKVKFIGGGASFANAALGGYLTTGWVVGGLANGGELVDGIKTGDVGKIVKTGVQGVTDVYFAYKMGGELNKGRRAEKAKVEESLAAERQRLERINASPDTGITWEQLDLSKATPEDMQKYGQALKELSIDGKIPENGLVELELSPRKRLLLQEKLKGTTIESIDMQEHGKRQDDRALDGKPITGDEVDAMFDASPTLAADKASRETLGVDLSGVQGHDFTAMRKAAEAVGGKIEVKSFPLVEVSIPRGKLAEFRKGLEGSGAKVLGAEEYRAAVEADGGSVAAHEETASSSKELDSLWDIQNGSKLTKPEVIKEGRQEAMAAAENPKLAKAAEAAAAKGEIAPASWQGLQGAEGNCLPHALANASHGAFTLADTVAAGVKAGADYAKGGTSEPQLMEMLLTLEEVGARRGLNVDYRAIPVEDYFRQQEQAAARGEPRQAGLLAMRTGPAGPGDLHGYHAVALRGQIVVEGQHYIVITDSHLNKPLLFTPEAFSASVVSNGILVVDVSPARGRQKRATKQGYAVAEPEGALGAPGEKSPTEAQAAKDGDGGHSDTSGSVEEQHRGKGQWEFYKITPSGQVVPIIDGVIDMPPGYTLARRNKRTGAVEIDGPVKGQREAVDAKIVAASERMRARK